MPVSQGIDGQNGAFMYVQRLSEVQSSAQPLTHCPERQGRCKVASDYQLLTADMCSMESHLSGPEMSGSATQPEGIGNDKSMKGSSVTLV